MWEKKKRERDSTTQGLRDKLNERERAAKRQKRVEEESKINLEQDIAKLKEEGLRIIREQQAQQERERKKTENSKISQQDKLQRTVKVNWGKTGEVMYSEDQLKRIFAGFGTVEHIVIAKTGKCAVILFETIGPALACERAMKNHPLYKFDVSLANKTTPQDEEGTKNSQTNGSQAAMLKAHEEFEKKVLEKMRMAQQQKQPKPQMEKTDGLESG